MATAAATVFDEATENAIWTLLKELLEATKDERFILYEGCEVITAPVGPPPEYITVQVDDVYDPNVEWRGTPATLGVGDFVHVWEWTGSKRREIFSPGGAAGIVGLIIHDHSSATTGGQDLHQIQELEFDDAALLTIAAGVVTRTQVYHIIAAQAGVADDLDNVLGGVEGDELVIRPDTGDTITCRHNIGGAGDFWFAGGANIVLGDQDHLRCIHDGTSWCDQSGGAGGALADHTHSAPGDGGDALRPETVSDQTFLVGPGCPHDTLGEAIVAVNAFGPGAATPCTIKIMAIVTTEVGDLTIPNYCDVIGLGPRASTIDMGTNTLNGGSYSSMQNLTITISDTVNNVVINGKTDWHLWNVCIHVTANAASNLTITGASHGWLRHVVLTRVSNGRGFNIGGTAIVQLMDCEAADALRFTEAFYMTDTADGVTWKCFFWGTPAGDDVYTTVNTLWSHVECYYRRSNSTILGTELIFPQSAIDLDGAPQGITLDADADTNLRSDTDDTPTLKVGGTDTYIWTSTAFKGTASIFPNLGTATLAEKLGHVYLGTNRDIYPMDDGGGLFQRNVNHWIVPTDHFNAFAGWTWAAYAPFDGAPSTVDVATWPSLLRLVNDNLVEDHFCYVAFSGTGSVWARICKGSYSYIGIRLQNGDDDNDDFVELRLIDGTTAGTVAIQRQYQTAGGGIVTTTLLDDLPSMWYLLRIYKNAANPHSYYYATNTPLTLAVGAGVAAAWTGVRAGLVFGQRFATTGTYAAAADWVRIE